MGTTSVGDQVWADPATSAWVSRCIRCADVTSLYDGVEGCSSCAAAGVAVPRMPFRVSGPRSVKPPPTAPDGLGQMWRWRPHLVPVGTPVSLGEGGTPLVGLDPPGVPGRVLMKQEGANPTGSFKDRLASATVSRARHLGADTVVVSSTGNAGVSVAAYAAAAGLQTVMLTVEGSALTSRAVATARAHGARVAVTRTSADRWVAARTGAEQLGWFPVTNHRTPPVASHPAGVHAYRSIAYEVAEALGWNAPDWVVVPVSRGDGLWGIWSGFRELAELGWTATVPRMLAVTRFPSLSQAVASGSEQPSPSSVDEPVAAVSISDPQSTAMAARAVRESRGDTLVCTDEQLVEAQRRLASRGHLVEMSSAAVLAGAVGLADRGEVGDDATTVVVATARDVDVQRPADRGAPVLLTSPADPKALRALAEHRGV